MTTPSPEAVEVAVEAALAVRRQQHDSTIGRQWLEIEAALKAAAPLMLADAKREALQEAADDAFNDKSIQGLQRTLIGTWLGDRLTKNS